jgi:arginine deiminase
MFSAGLRAWMREMPAAELAGRLTQGVMASEVPGHVCPVMSRATRPTDFVIAPLPNHLFTRDASAWIGAGVALAVMRCPIRRREALNVEAIYRWHPRFRGARLKVWIGGGDHDWGDATIDGGDVIAAGEGVVVLGEGGRTTAAAASMLAGKLIAAGAARIVIGARLPGPHARRHLDTALAFCDRHVVAVREPVVSAIAAVRYEADGDGGVTATLSERPLLDELRDELGVTDLTVVAGDEHDTLGVVALAPGVVVADERNESTNQRLADAGVEVHVTPAQELGRARGAAHGMTCPVWRDP